MFAAALLASTAAFAADVKPAVIYDLGGKFDKSFNEGVFNGATKFTKDTGVAFRDLEIQNDAQREQVLRKFAKDGFSPIMTVGFAWATALGKVADEFPQDQVRHHRHGRRQAQRAVDRVQGRGRLVPGRRDRGQDLEDRQGRLRRRHGHSADLARSNAATRRASNTSTTRTTCIANMTGTDAGGLERSGQGRRTRQGADRSQGADIVFAAAGATGQGVLKAAADAGKFGIGVDSDQDNLFPGKVLTSMLKRVDVATYKSFKAAKDGTWKAGIQVFGLKEGGVGYAEDEWNKAILTGRRQEGGRSRQGRHHLRQDQRARLHVRQQVPGVIAVWLLPPLSWPGCARPIHGR